MTKEQLNLLYSIEKSLTQSNALIIKATSALRELVAEQNILICRLGQLANQLFKMEDLK